MKPAAQMEWEDQITREVLEPAECKKIVPEGTVPIWAYRYKDSSRGWELTIATHGEPGSKKLSLGGFRIAPEDRASTPGFTTAKEAIGLALGMEEKVYWSRIIKVGGPLGLPNLGRIVGGKCVFLPTKDARVGCEYDYEALDFATHCLKRFESETEVYLTTGQDLGHGKMSNGAMTSLQYLHKNFEGSVLEDTSKPTGEGNFYTLKGMLAGFGMELEASTVGFIGCGNVGEHVVRRALENGVKAKAIEANPQKVEILKDLGVEVLPLQDKQRFLSLSLDAVCINASGGTLDSTTVTTICNNPKIKFTCGSENLCMANGDDAKRLLSAEKLHCPTELGGMMGYLTAVEEYLSRKQGASYSVQSLFEAAKRLEEAGEEAARYTKKKGFKFLFEDAIRQIYNA